MAVGDATGRALKCMARVQMDDTHEQTDKQTKRKKER
jgi:hypothetical protein